LSYGRDFLGERQLYPAGRTKVKPLAGRRAKPPALCHPPTATWRGPRGSRSSPPVNCRAAPRVRVRPAARCPRP